MIIIIIIIYLKIGKTQLETLKWYMRKIYTNIKRKKNSNISNCPQKAF